MCVCVSVSAICNQVMLMDFESKSITNDWNSYDLHEMFFDNFASMNSAAALNQLITSIGSRKCNGKTLASRNRITAAFKNEAIISLNLIRCYFDATNIICALSL